MYERGILEIAKALGVVDIISGHKLFTREYFTTGMFNHPFIFIASNGTSGVRIIAECENEKNAIELIKFIIAADKLIPRFPKSGFCR